MRWRLQRTNVRNSIVPYLHLNFKVRPEAAILQSKDNCAAKLVELRKSLSELSLDGIFADADITALNVLLMGRMANGTVSLLSDLVYSR